jgi:signal transduction histidine kinase
MNEQPLTQKKIPANPKQPNVTPSPDLPAAFGELFTLSGSQNLDDLLGKAISIIVKTTGAEAGSVLFYSQTLTRVRAGVFRPQVLARIRAWEDVVGRRLEESDWRIADQTSLPVSVTKVPEIELALVNIPLLANTGLVVGSLSLVLPPGRQMTPAQQTMLTQLATGLGHLAALHAQFELAQDRLRQMEVFYKVGQALMTTFDINILLAETMRLAAEVIDAGAASLMLIDENNEELVFEVSLGSRGHVLRQQRIPLDEGIAGWVARTGTAAISNNARTDPRFSHRVDVRTGFLTQSIAAVPLKVKGRVIGVLEVLNKYAESGFQEDDTRIMSVIAAQAAIAIENARLYQRVRQERDHILKAQEDVRHELNRKLHDGPVQLLSAISISLDHLERLKKVKPEALDGAIDAARNLVNQTTRETRTILFELRPLILETQGLVAAFEQYVGRLREAESFKVHFKSVPTADFHPNVAGVIFSIVQEAVNNIKRHAQAKNVWLTLETRNSHFVVTVKDDGKGFEANTPSEGQDEHGGFGLTNMQDRAALIEAQFSLESRTTSPNRGTVVQLILPPAET